MEASFDDIWQLWPYGDRSTALAMFTMALRKTYKGKPITSDFLHQKYQDYVQTLKPHQNERFTRKEFRIVTLEDWLEKEMWKIEVHFKDPLDFYLYGIE